MVLVFESKTYESITQTILFSIFKYGYIAHKYQLCYKLFYVLETIIEIFLMMFLLSISYTDLTNRDIREYGNIFNGKFDETKFSYTNFDNKMSFFINFFEFITKMNKHVYFLVQLFFLLFFLLKFSQFVYFTIPKVKVINAKGPKKILFYIFAFQDQLTKLFLDVIIVTLSLANFNCSGGFNIFNDTECYVGVHLATTIISSAILFFMFFYKLIQSFFYDPCNLIQNDNFGVSTNIYNDLVFFACKIALAIFDLFELFNKDQDIIKIGIFFGLNLFVLYIIFHMQCKIFNFYQNAIIFKSAFFIVYSVMVFLYIIFDKKISLLIYIMSLIVSILIAILVVEFFKRSKTLNLYTREENLENYSDVIYVIELILNYHQRKMSKIIINGFIQCYNIEYDEEIEKCKEIDEIIQINKTTPMHDINETDSSLINPSNVKYLLTMKNMFILGSLREAYTRISKKKEINTYKKYKQMKLLEFISDVIYKHSVKSHDFSFQFKLLTVQIFLRKLNNITRAWFILSNFYETFNKFSVLQQFFIFSMYQELHENLQICDMYSMHKKVKIKRIIKLDKSNNKFIKKITKCTNMVKIFWINYMNFKQKNRFISKEVSDSLEKINHKYKKLQDFFTEIQKLFQDNKTIFYVYCCFIKNVMNNEQLGDHIIKLLFDKEKSSLLQKNTKHELIDDDYYKMLNLESVGLIIISCNTLEIGKIKWCNNNLSNILLYSQKELSKLKLNRLIPPVIANKHNEFIKYYIQNNSEYYTNITHVSFMINSFDHIIPVIICTNLLPRIKNGIEMYGIITKVIDNTFILYKNPEIKYKTKLCFVLINEDGSIEAVDRNANMFLGIPNLVRNGWKTKITIEKRKCNLFELSPGLKAFLGENSSKNNFLNECDLDTSVLLDEFYNDEYGLFLSINNRINYLISKGISVNKWNGTKDYYDPFTEADIASGNEKDPAISSKIRYEYQNIIIQNVFKCHNLLHEIYTIQSSKDGSNSLKLYLIKYYFPIELFINQKEKKKDLTMTQGLNPSGASQSMNTSNVNSANPIGTILTVSGINSPNAGAANASLSQNRKRTEAKVQSILSKKSFLNLRSQTRINSDIKRSNQTLSTISNTALFNYNEKNKEAQESMNASSTKNKTQTMSLEKLRLRKEIMIQEKITNQSASYKKIQALFLLIILILVIIISLEVYYRITQIKYLRPLQNLLFLFINRRDLTTNLILCTLWHIEVENAISKSDSKPVFELSSQKLLNIIKQDTISIKTFQDEVLDYYGEIQKYKIYSNYTTTYTEYDSYHNLITTSMLIDSVYDMLISNFDKYFLYTNYKFTSKKRILELFNPLYYLQTETFNQTDFEMRMLDILTNGHQLIILSDNKLIKELIDYLNKETKEDERLLFIFSITAICFTFIFTLGVLFLFIKIINEQDDLFKIFINIDFNCAIKVSVVCDKFLKILSSINHSPTIIAQLHNFYYTDHGKVFNLITMMLFPGEKKATQKTPTQNNNNSNSNNQNKSSNNNSSDSLYSSAMKGKVSTSQSVIYSGGLKIKGCDPEMIMRYKRFAEEKKKKNAVLDSAQSPTGEQNQSAIIVKHKGIILNTFFIFLIFIVVLCGFFIGLLFLDFGLKKYVDDVLNYIQFFQHRMYYSVNNIFFFKFVVLKSTKTSYPEESLVYFTNFLNLTVENEEAIQDFLTDGSFDKFDKDIGRFDKDPVCNFFLENTNVELSNNLTAPNQAICEDEEETLFNKTLGEVILFTNSFLREKYNHFIKVDKTDENILSFLNDDRLEYVSVLTQFIIRQCVFVILGKLNRNFEKKITNYSTWFVLLFCLFVVVIILVVFLANVCSFFVFRKKKKINELLISLMPDEFIWKQLEDEREERERKKEVE